MSAIDKLGKLTAEGKALVTVNCKVSPEMKELIYDLKARTGRQVSMILQDSLDKYFVGYAEKVAELDKEELTDEELTDEDLE